jgi:hypothetical protein
MEKRINEVSEQRKAPNSIRETDKGREIEKDERRYCVRPFLCDFQCDRISDDSSDAKRTREGLRAAFNLLFGSIPVTD